ncbi:hypothetical protein [Paraburkholderia fynbosensis]|uniref:hypothetical protein n=1 Tax=Paraburkholderia fynbosensis TaxID=1200993 RepID=UPI0015841C89|nr:hypothetical protein [Paraburkholderia fynbosensis]
MKRNAQLHQRLLIGNIDLCAPLDDGQYAALRAALLKHKLLVFQSVSSASFTDMSMYSKGELVRRHRHVRPV